MPLPQVSPGGGGRRASTHFCYVRTPNETNWNAWIAGPCHWFDCHTRGRTKPCVHAMTKGEVACRCAGTGEGCEEIGYQPLYREVDAKPVMVIVHDYTREIVDALKLHQRVLVGRGSEQSDGVYLTAALRAEPRYQSTLASRLQPADLTGTLLKLWRIPELVVWYNQTHGAGDDPIEHAAPPRSVPRAPVARPTTAPVLPAANADGTFDLDDGFLDSLAADPTASTSAERNELFKKASQNGKHKPKPR